MTETAGEDEFLKELAANFLRDMLVQTEALEANIQGQEKEKIAVFGHTLRGSGAMFGFPEISVLGTQLEDAARAEHWEIARETSRTLRKVIEKSLD